MNKLILRELGLEIHWSQDNRSLASISRIGLITDQPTQDVIESLVLAHFCAGINVSSKAYIEGILTTIEADINNVSDSNELCPKCKSVDIVGSPVTIDFNGASQEYHCSDCDHEWTGLYKYIGIEQ